MRRFAQAITDVDSLPAGLPPAVTTALADGADRYNIGKGKPAAVLLRGDDDTVEVRDMVWGLVPRWSKEPATPYTTVTARLERAPQSRIYAQAWQQRPCVVAMTGYYKWDRQQRPPRPLFVQRRDGLALLVAGLWEHWEAPQAAGLDSFSILTAPNRAIPPPLTADGPVFVDAATALAWLGGTLTTPGALQRRAATPPLEAYPVGRAFRDPTRDDYTLLEPAPPEAEDDAPLDAADDEGNAAFDDD